MRKLVLLFQIEKDLNRSPLRYVIYFRVWSYSWATNDSTKSTFLESTGNGQYLFVFIILICCLFDKVSVPHTKFCKKAIRQQRIRI